MDEWVAVTKMADGKTYCRFCNGIAAVKIKLCEHVQRLLCIVSENEYPVDANKYSCLLVHSTTPQYRGDTPEALAASLHSEFSSSSSSIGVLAARYCKLISAHLADVSGSGTGRHAGRRALHVGCATGRITFELTTIFNEVRHTSLAYTVTSTASTITTTILVLFSLFFHF